MHLIVIIKHFMEQIFLQRINYKHIGPKLLDRKICLKKKIVYNKYFQKKMKNAATKDITAFILWNFPCYCDIIEIFRFKFLENQDEYTIDPMYNNL